MLVYCSVNRLSNCLKRRDMLSHVALPFVSAKALVRQWLGTKVNRSP